LVGAQPLRAGAPAGTAARLAVPGEVTERRSL